MSEQPFNFVDVDDERVPPYSVPSFVNITYVSSFGLDIYIDMGFVSVEGLRAIKEGAEDASINMYGRFVMSALTFDAFAKNIATLREQLQTAGVIGQSK